MAIPRFNFQPIITPFVKAPVGAFSDTIDTLNTNYDTSLENMSRLRQAQAALQAAPFEEDQRLLQDTLNTFNKRYSDISSRNDLENATVLTKRLLSDFSEKAIPITQRNTQVRDEINRIMTNPNIKDKQRAINAFKLQERLNPTIQEIEGSIINQFDPSRSSFLYTPQVNLREKVDDIIRGIQTNTISLRPEIKQLTHNGEPVLNYIQTGRIEELPPEKVQTVIEAGLSSDQEVINFRNRERQFGELGSLAQESGIEDGIDGIQDDYNRQYQEAVRFGGIKYPFKNVNLSQSFSGLNGSGSGDESANAIISTTDTSADLISSGEAYRNLSSQIAQLRASGNNEVADQLEQEQEKFNSIALSELTPDERKIFNAFQDYEVRGGDLSKLNQGRGADISNEINNINNIINDLGLSDKYSASLAGIQGNDKIPIARVLEKGSQLINKNTSNFPQISRNYKAFTGEGEGLGKGRLGVVQDILNNDTNKQNFSIVKAFTKDNSTNLNQYLDRKYEEIEIEGEKYNFNNTQVAPTNGITLDGFPMVQISIFGKGEDGRVKRIGTELATKGESGWTDYINTAKGLLESDLTEDNIQGNLMMMKANSIGNNRIGSYIAKKNLSSLQKGVSKDINIGQLDGKIEQIYQSNQPTGRFIFTFDDGTKVPINSEDDLIVKIYNANN